MSYSSGILRLSHSFPTRRSSDLVPTRIALTWSGLRLGWRSSRSAAAPETTGPRSEEHTSELQSLRHLVCRLLLEKKKNQDADRSSRDNYLCLGPHEAGEQRTI